MISTKCSVLYLAALHMVVCSAYGKVLEIVNNKPQLKERRKLLLNFFFLTYEFTKNKLKVNKVSKYSSKYVNPKIDLITLKIHIEQSDRHLMKS